MPQTRSEIRFLLNDDEIHLSDISANDTLLDYLRVGRRLCGSKEGCAEGDCGACTVLVGRMHRGTLTYEAVNSCIRLMPSLDACHVVTVEHLQHASGALHPVQQALVEMHGSQCGFCTPGIVMSLYALWLTRAEFDVADVEQALQGNLCRCTGYRPIIEAALKAGEYGAASSDILITRRDAITARLRALCDDARIEVRHNGRLAVLPADLDDLAEILSASEEAQIIAGATDVGLWVTKSLQDISPAIFVGHLEALKTIKSETSGLTLGAGVTYSECAEILAEHFPHLRAYWLRIGGWQIRNMGTVGGNIANGSPIGDTPPVLIALGAELVLRRQRTRRTLPLESFFIDYGKQDRGPAEFVEAVHIPALPAGSRVAAYKVSKRRDEDISSVCAGFSVILDGGQDGGPEGGTIADARLAYGGLAAIPKRAAAAEAALIGRPWSLASIQKAAAALREDFTPISDWRASADYRARVASNLLIRFYEEQEHAGRPARLDA